MTDNFAPNSQPRYEPVNSDENVPYPPSPHDEPPFGSTPAGHGKENVAVFSAEGLEKQKARANPTGWRLKTILKKWRMQILDVSARKKKKRQVPIVKDRFTAILAAMVHLPAIAGIITLSFYIFKNYYIGKELEGKPDYDVEKKLGIQLAAKLMEMFIVLSLNAIVFSMIRHEFTMGQSVPYGALVAGQQISEISFLWSEEFFSILKGRFSQQWKKMGFILTVFVCTIMALGASSLSAVAMMPQEGDWRAGGSFVYFNSTREDMFPTVVTENNTVGSVCNVTGNELCPSWQWDVINSQLVSNLGLSGEVDSGLFIRRPPSEILVAGRSSTLVNLGVDVREKWFNLNSPNHTVARMPHLGPAEACVTTSLHWEQAADDSAKRGQTRFNNFQKLAHKLSAPMPITNTRCELTSVSDAKVKTLLFPDFVVFPPTTLDVKRDTINGWLSDVLPNLSKPEVFWFDSAPVVANTSVGVVVAVPSNKSKGAADIYGCMMDARWITADLSADAVALTSKGYPPFSGAIATALGGSWIGNPGYGQRVHLAPSFARYLNPLDTRSNRTVVHEMLLNSGVWTTDGKGSKSAAHLEAILGGLAVNGLARSAPNISAITTLADPDGEWWKSFMPQDGKVFGPGASPYAVSDEEKERFLKTEMETWVTGFAFADNSLTMRGAMAVFYVYALLVIAYSIWSIWSGITSSSWESVPDLLALALADKSSGSDCGGSLDVMKENFCISADGSTLRLRATSGLVLPENRVRPNEALNRCSSNCQDHDPTIYEELIGLLRNLPDQDAQLVLKRIRSGADVGSVLQQAKAGDVLLQMAVVPETRYRYEFPYRAEMPKEFYIDNLYMNSLLYETASLYSYRNGPELVTPSALTDLVSEEQKSPYLKPFHAAQVVEPLLNDAKISRWTNVSKDNALMRDLLRVMFRCEYQFTAAFHKDLFLQDLVAGRTDFCSSLLVNIVLAYACVCYPQMSNRVEYWNPDNLVYRFVAEAKRLWELDAKVPRITTIQAGILFTVFHNFCGVDEVGKAYRLHAISLAQQLSIFDTAVASRSDRIQKGREYTAWALYNWETLSAFLFMFSPLIKEPPIWTPPDPSIDPSWYGETWVSYPLNQGLTSLDMGQVLRARCQFRIVMNEFCSAAYSGESRIDLDLAHHFRRRLESWYRGLPESLTPRRIVLPGQLQVHLYYHHLLLTIFEPLLDVATTEELSPHRVVANAKKNLHTLVRLYFLRHGFEAMDLFIAIPIMMIGYETINVINDDTPTDKIESLRATLILAAQGLYHQRRNYYLAQVLFRVIRGKMRPQEIGLLETSMAIKLGDVDRESELAVAVRSQWPVTNVKKQEEINPHVLNNLVNSFGDMSVEEDT
ncbi:hypothetical protein FLONG3_5182 [Fusarium longipes]|uniref:Xylanolytic transcriptional activator regulatory domain-containing protein n=1 Tax=Fusarium longipes TaxID=694270 RepID=A0A395SXE6_9HYPO|nr:hypothetical protein FLONG3_5182 [Fusarium longipes]